ncbi:SusC/RagA family TonB-linked outer membrane protein [Winogradskyella psychrotolerans]|uniref:SusC/RagA family TonB-linked outer membrane protein n=1 Tax=Winogradskyella psychrotolerans TaxID=1344585 RepID=UPI001C07DF4B|nr:SusC/RagA family TonB-linked outer membrane protein [Winogradskyella psychrotolerans]MBU2922200.1 SusC/RagA family TonB-linked outer membrane protein [Winogradskyella psychrotolerans]
MKLKLTWLLTLFMAFVMQFSFAQEKTVTGTVTTASDGLPLPGASVIVKGTSRGQQTDFDGKFTIKVNQGDVLVVSYVGMEPASIIVGAAATYDVALKDASTLEEVVIVGYGTSSLAKSLAATKTVSGDVLEDRANPSALQNLQGQIAGLNVTTGSGQPGADSVIVLRGVGSINGNIEPLFVIDGIPVDEDNFKSINPNDVESYTVLKDAAATSIYGNRGANGVIVITTKKGRAGEGLKFRYTTTYGYNEIQAQPFDLMSTGEILNWQRDNNAGLGNGMSNAEINARAAQANTNWTDIFFRKGTTTTHDLAITSGTETTSNYTSLQYFEQDGVFIGSDFKRFSVRNNFTGKSADKKFDYGINLNLNFSKSNELDNAGSNSTFFNPFSAALQGLPYLSAYDPNGSRTIDGGITPGDITALLASGATNFPYVLLNSVSMNTDRTEEVKILAGFNASYNFAKNLTARIEFGGDLSSSKRLEVLHPLSLLGPFQSEQSNAAEYGGIYEETYARDFRFYSNTSLNYSNIFADKHAVSLTAYLEYNRSFYDGFDYDQTGLDPRLLGTGSAFIPANTIEVINGADTFPYLPALSTTTLTTGLFSVFANGDYEFDGKYGIGATVRRDNSFRFVEDNAWGTFWSVSGRWNISDENFMSDSAFDLLKLRGSYGTSGNQRITGGFYGALNNTRSLYSAGQGYNNQTGTFASQIGNTTLQWEEVAQANIGVDFSLWTGKLRGSVDVYEKTTSQLFQDNRISYVNGTGSIQSNLGTLVNKGVELDLRYTPIQTKDWGLTLFANGSFNENVIEELPPSTDGLVINTLTALGEGQAYGSYYLVDYVGVNPANGNPLFRGADGNLTESLNESDRQFTGKSHVPVWQGGFGTLLKYKTWEFNTTWSWVADVYRSSEDLAGLEEVSVGQVENGRNRINSVFNAWQNPGDITDIPRVGSAYSSVDYSYSTDRYLQDASFLRLRNITLAYSLPKETLEKLPITGLRLYAQGENLLTFTKYVGWDPESSVLRSIDRGQYPTPKIYTFGVTINF